MTGLQTSVSDCAVPLSPKEEELVRRGWQKQMAYDEPRLSEAVELYRSMGREVHLEPVAFENQPLGEACNSCFAGCNDRMKVVWTREAR